MVHFGESLRNMRKFDLMLNLMDCRLIIGWE